jgi:hypothetical protein
MISQNGWVASEDQNAIGIKSFKVPGTKIRLRCAKKVAPLLVTFAAEFHTNIERIHVGKLDDWGYAFRNVKGSTDKLSNHASGTAIDLNATDHPLGHAGTFTQMQTVMIQALCKKYGLQWGGNWQRPDEMHFEVSVNEAQCAALIEKLNLVKGKKWIN